MLTTVASRNTFCWSTHLKWEYIDLATTWHSALIRFFTHCSQLWTIVILRLAAWNGCLHNKIHNLIWPLPTSSCYISLSSGSKNSLTTKWFISIKDMLNLWGNVHNTSGLCQEVYSQVLKLAPKNSCVPLSSIVTTNYKVISCFYQELQTSILALTLPTLFHSLPEIKSGLQITLAKTFTSTDSQEYGTIPQSLILSQPLRTYTVPMEPFHILLTSNTAILLYPCVICSPNFYRL